MTTAIPCLAMRALGVVCSLLAVASSAWAAPADLDPTFGTAGFTNVPSSAQMGALAMQADGKLLVATTAAGGSGGPVEVRRFDVDGILDPTWGAAGVRSLAPGGLPIGATVQPDGKLLLLVDLPVPGRFGIYRLLSTGAPDLGWGVGGRVLTPITPVAPGFTFAGGNPMLHANDDGTVLLAGTSSNSVACARFLPDGSLDTSLGGVGIALAPVSGGATAIAVQPDGKILLAGGGEMTVARLFPTGTPDFGFGVGGVATTQAGTIGADHVTNVLIQADGKIVLAGNDGAGGIGPGQMAAARFLPDGTADSTYGSGGAVVANIPAHVSVNTFGAILQGNDHLLLIGGTAIVLVDIDTVTARITDSGTLDPSWNGTGLAQRDLGGIFDFGVSGVLQPSGGLVVLALDFVDAKLFRLELGAFCGDGIVQAGEQCDDGNAVAGDCCDASCQLQSAGTLCTDDGDVCTADTCDAGGSCLHVGQPDGTPCEDGLPCTTGETCTAGACGGGVTGGAGCVNPFVCYKSAITKGQPKFSSESGINLDDEIEAGLFDAKVPFELCIPAEIDDQEVQNPDVRHVAYKIKKSTGEPKHVKHTDILVEDHFGTHVFDTKKPELLLVPADLSLLGPTAPPPPGSAEHYKCYKVKQSKSAPKFKQTIAAAADEFEDRFYQVFSPRRLCLPVDKNGEGILEPGFGLTCYRMRRGAGQPNHDRVEDQIHTADPFGPLRLDTKIEKDLCMPAEILDIP